MHVSAVPVGGGLGELQWWTALWKRIKPRPPRSLLQVANPCDSPLQAFDSSAAQRASNIPVTPRAALRSLFNVSANFNTVRMHSTLPT